MTPKTKEAKKSQPKGHTTDTSAAKPVDKAPETPPSQPQKKEKITNQDKRITNGEDENVPGETII